MIVGQKSLRASTRRLLGQWYCLPSHSFLRKFLSSSSHSDRLSVQGRLKNPIIEQLWSDLYEMRQQSNGNDNSNLTDLSTPKTPSQSMVSVRYPFSTDAFFMETYRNPFGQMRFGKILEDIDALAGNVAFYHASYQNQPNFPMVVTASVDRITLNTYRPDKIGSDVVLSGKVTYVGKSSMETRLQCVDDNGCCWLEAFLTFVTLDSQTFQPRPNPQLLPESKEEQQHFDAGKARAELKKQTRCRGKDPTQLAQLDVGASELLDQAGLLIHMPSLADHSTSILVNDTQASNMEVAQPQVQNYHGRIFGGFLMRRAYELAFANCFMFAGQLPVFLEVDEVSFRKAVDVGDLIVFQSRVLYTQEPRSDIHPRTLVYVEVETWVTDPTKKTANVTNRFYFTFGSKEKCRQVFPSNIDQARKIAARMAADKAAERKKAD